MSRTNRRFAVRRILAEIRWAKKPPKSIWHTRRADGTRATYGPNVAEFLVSLLGPRPAPLWQTEVEVEGRKVPLIRYESLAETRRRIAGTRPYLTLGEELDI